MNLKAPISELLQCARHGELDDLRLFVEEWHRLFTATATTDQQEQLSSDGTCSNHREEFEWISQHDPATGNNTMIHMASANGHLDIITYLISIVTSYQMNQISQQELINARNDEGNTPLHWAVLNGHAAVVEYLIVAGADAKLKNYAGQSALYLAQMRNNEEMESLLLRLVDYGDDNESDNEEEENEESNDNDDTEMSVVVEDCAVETSSEQVLSEKLSRTQIDAENESIIDN